MNHAAQLRNLACAIQTHTPFKLVAPFKTLARACLSQSDLSTSSGRKWGVPTPKM